MFSQIYHFIRKSKKTIRVDQKLPTRCSLIDETMKVVKNFALPEVDSTSFPGFSPTRPTERERVRSVGRVGENPGNEVEVDFELQAGIISFLDFLRKEHVIQKN